MWHHDSIIILASENLLRFLFEEIVAPYAVLILRSICVMTSERVDDRVSPMGSPKYTSDSTGLRDWDPN